ncbi:hypothetical protein D3C73_959970 [compost metagenome]
MSAPKKPPTLFQPMSPTPRVMVRESTIARRECARPCAKYSTKNGAVCDCLPVARGTDMANKQHSGRIRFCKRETGSPYGVRSGMFSESLLKSQLELSQTFGMST